MQISIFSTPLDEPIVLPTTSAPTPTRESAPAAKGTKMQPIAAHRLVRETPTYGYFDASTPIREAKDAYRIMEPICAHESTESFYILCLNAQHRVTQDGIVTVSRGTLNSTLVNGASVYRAALAANAYAIILCHNHPSGDPTPSPEDRMITQQLVSAGRTLGIEVLDPIIVGDGRFTSFAESGILS